METTDDGEQIFREIVELRTQYQAEVGSRRKAWPRSIIDRVFQLSRLGIKYRVIAERSGIPLNTIYSWESRPPKLREGTFISLPVKEPVPSQAPPRRERAQEIPTVTVVMRDGTRIEGLPASGVIKFLKSVRR